MAESSILQMMINLVTQFMWYQSHLQEQTDIPLEPRSSSDEENDTYHHAVPKLVVLASVDLFPGIY